ncbi:uncharacterized protein LOC106462197 [Limulus polyphemus]|uniref:Uncharacterized protein LOC106462197 n=1 Tax=Limulus polyphemus TaxID=6850 RepID=A0ABM1B9H6_LIMPO|nr:uncharacterized protein LOC106462197 [Limulus polyphemus]
MEKPKDGSSVMDYGPDGHNSLGPDFPPPAYPKRNTSALKIARTVSFTLIMITFLIGVFVLLGCYIRLHQSKCECEFENIPQQVPLESVQHQSEIKRYDPDPLLAVDSQPIPSKKMTAIPLRLHLDGDTGRMIKKNHKARVNCVVEKKKSMELTAHEPKTVMTPLGNITTDPRLIHVLGERMVFSCHSDMHNTHKPMDNYKEIPSRSRRDINNMYSCDCSC